MEFRQSNGRFVRGANATYKKFLKNFRSLAAKEKIRWYLHGLAIRRSSDCACPITAVCESLTGKKFSSKLEWWSAAEAINLNPYIALEIAQSADGQERYNVDYISELDDRGKEIRKDLLSAVGLSSRK